MIRTCAHCGFTGGTVERRKHRCLHPLEKNPFHYLPCSRCCQKIGEIEYLLTEDGLVQHRFCPLLEGVVIES